MELWDSLSVRMTARARDGEWPVKHAILEIARNSCSRFQGNVERSFLMRSPKAVPASAWRLGSPRYGSEKGAPLLRTKRSPQPTSPNRRINSWVGGESGTI